MNDFNRCKVTGVRWLKKPVRDIQISVKLKPLDGILSLPKFDDYINESNGLQNLHKLEVKTEEYNFKWQEKVFSSWELQRYSDIHNCKSETELNYHDMISNEDHKPSKVFTYIHEDYHLPLPADFKKTSSDENSVANLTSCFNNLTICDRLNKLVVQARDVMMVLDTSSMGHLFKSSENILEEDEKWKAMHIVFDNSEYNEDFQLLLKQETVLLSLYHNTTHNYLIVSPNVNNLELNPYTIETESEVPLGYQYSVELDSEDTGNGEELVSLLQKLLKKWERHKKNLINFEMPALGKKVYCISFEILTASDFDMDNLYIDFIIKVPENVQCSDCLRGRTHVTSPVRTEGKEHWHFGHIIELNLEMTTGSDPSPLQIFFEIISMDWWGRHRTEGYTYLSLPLQPGHFKKQLSCSSPDETDSVEAESRRFFVGGCHLIKDLDVLVKPHLLDPKIKFVTTGNLQVRWNTVSQTALPGSLPKSEIYGTTSASALLQGAEAVLRQYRKARARLAAATEGLAGGEPSGN